MAGIVLGADLHLGSVTHDGPDLDGSPSWRQNEALRVVDFLHDTALKREAYLATLGDLFTNVRPQAWAYRMAQRLYRDGGIVFPGNHDDPVGEGVTSPLRVLPLSHMLPVFKPAVLKLDDAGIDVAVIPFFGRAFVAATYPDLAVGEQNRYMAQALERIVADLCSQKREGVPLIVVTHFTIGGATWNSGVQPQVGESADFIIPRSVFDRPEIAWVFAGHIHKPQTFGNVTYIGSPIRSDFGEEGQTTRILHVTPDGDGVAVEEIITPSVEFVSIDIDADATPFDMAARTNFHGKVVRFVGEAATGEETAARIAQKEGWLTDGGVLHIAKHAIKFTRHEARVVRAIEIESSPAAALRSYAEMVGGEYAGNLEELLVIQSELEGATR